MILILTTYLQITKHYSKPGVVPVDVLPVFPDFQVIIFICKLDNSNFKVNHYRLIK